ncbi:DNA-binding transcriptional ArsR family regulator [Kribbella aluminosa]|uniref:DNA-binding transcriptional ArsR family regulator n=1 Tax=Kribbella aluminosa TaxID=416017 RepID=A0ABS4UMA4_9ACTN|nr:metalloregulator ArsR/SmtB family transcription factor [Kribbella aluminosa]MBP2352778.1 DNA-binding transcriptional ArsR family regulator [Kribbella aluminosa]
MDSFGVLAQPQRRLILDALIQGERPVGDLVDELGLSQPVVSKQLRILREAEMVVVRGDSQRRLYRINPAPFAEIDAWLDRYRQFWARRLDALQAHLETEEHQ